MALSPLDPTVQPIKRPGLNPAGLPGVQPVGPSRNVSGLGIVQATVAGQRPAPTGHATDVGTPSSAPIPPGATSPIKFVPGGVYSSHGPPAGMTCPAGQKPTEEPAGSGFWRCDVDPNYQPPAPTPAQPLNPAGGTGGASAPTSGPGNTGLNTGTDNATQRLIDLASAMFAGAGAPGGGGTGGPVLTTDATPTTTSSGTSGATIFIILLIVAGLGYAFYKSHKKRKEGGT